MGDAKSDATAPATQPTLPFSQMWGQQAENSTSQADFQLLQTKLCQSMLQSIQQLEERTVTPSDSNPRTTKEGLPTTGLDFNSLTDDYIDFKRTLREKAGDWCGGLYLEHVDNITRYRDMAAARVMLQESGPPKGGFIIHT